jgi:hypothetical protein
VYSYIVKTPVRTLVRRETFLIKRFETFLIERFESQLPSLIGIWHGPQKQDFQALSRSCTRSIDYTRR